MKNYILHYTKSLRATILLLLFVICGSTWAQEDPYIEITFKTNSSEPTTTLTNSTFLSFIQSGQEYVSSFSSIDHCYEGQYGVRMWYRHLGGFIGNGGSFTVNLNDSYMVSRVVIGINQPAGSNIIKVTIGNTTVSTARFGQEYWWNNATSGDGEVTFNNLETSSLTFFQQEGSGYIIGTGVGSYINRIRIYYKGYTVNTNKNGWAAFYANEQTKIPSGADVYTVTALGDNGFTFNKLSNYVPAQTGVIVKNSQNTSNLTYGDNNNFNRSYFFKGTSSSVSAPSGNLLTGTATQIQNPNYGGVYVMNTVNGVTSFYKLSQTGTIKANRAYFNFPQNKVKAGDSLEFDFTQIVDAISAIKEEQTTDNDAIYDLQGRMVKTDAILPSGIYIKNGKKFLVK